MSSIAEQYLSVCEQLQAIATRYEQAEGQLKQEQELDQETCRKRMENLELQLKKIDEYEEKVTYFRHIAEKHLESKNILTITPRELNFNRLRNWAMMIDPMESDDPYAKRIYVQCKCNEMFLAQKKAEFQETLAQLQGEHPDEDAILSEAVAELKRQLVNSCRLVVEGGEFALLAEAVCSQNRHYSEEAGLRLHGTSTGARIGLGVCAQTLPILEEIRALAKEKLGDYYDTRTSSILLPVDHAIEKEVVISARCIGAKEKKLYRGVQNYLLNQLAACPMGAKKVRVLDAIHFNNTALGALKPLEGSSILPSIPRDAEQITDALKEIVSSFYDIDEALELMDSVQEFNASVKEPERLARIVLVLIGYPSAFSGEAKKYVRRILMNHEHYGISVILMDNQIDGKTEEKADALPVEMLQNLYQVSMTQKKELITQNTGTEHHFRWYELRKELPEMYLTAVKHLDEKDTALGTEYTKRIDMEHIPPYERGRKSVVLPYGVDAKDEIHSLSFDNENFASFLMGASGSGKSTMLHTLITGILRNYHPDDVELWLADFKMSEFAQYMDPMPPHVKYILLDESPELVYDLLDRLTEKMMERQRFFMKHRELKKVENVPSTVYMPVIFVILDEFSIMSQAVADSEVYKLRLQNLLAKGRALGIKFIFASQTFTKGVSGLTQTAKDQIQTRIAMKNSYSEINDTLELSSNMRTEQVRNWMEAIPAHYALTKYRDGEAIRVKRLQVMYFAGKGDEALIPQRNLINRLREQMHPVSLEAYDPEDLMAYVDKKPVIVDGNSYHAFRPQQIESQIAEYRHAHTDEIAEDDLVLTFGAPRRMEKAKYAVISNESRENIMMIARTAEQAPGMSLVQTAMESFRLQGGRVHIWAYHKNRLYRAYKDSHFSRFEVAEDLEEICRAIAAMKQQILEKKMGSDLIVLLGMEQICSDFELIDFSDSAASASAFAVDLQQLGARTEEEQAQVQQVVDIQRLFNEVYDVDALEEQWMEEGKSMEEIVEEELRMMDELAAKQGGALGLQPKEEPQKSEEPSLPEEEPEMEEAPVSDAYDASEDFKYILRQGSRFGYHFMVCLNSLTDLRSMHLQQELFRHKLVFQLSADDSVTLFGNKNASRLPEHICQYDSTFESYSMRPFLHAGITWDGWEIDENGHAVSALMM